MEKAWVEGEETVCPVRRSHSPGLLKTTPGTSLVGSLPCNAGDVGSIPGQETGIPCVCVCVCVCVCLSQVQLFVTPWTVACRAPLSVHGILQARIPDWFAISFSRGSFWPRDWTRSTALQAESLPSEPAGTLTCLGISKPWCHNERFLHDPIKTRYAATKAWCSQINKYFF